MAVLFTGGFLCLCIVCLMLYLYTRSAVQTDHTDGFRRFQWTYLAVYGLAMAADWLQGPHVYALYQGYGMTPHQIQILFAVGFGSSMLVGTIVGAFADKYGRRANCILYGVLYGLSCMTKHSPNFWVLMVGRFLGGTATSILYSAFESWLIYEHNKNGFSAESLGSMFSLSVLANSLIAIVAGLIAQWFADVFGFVAPFDVSLTLLILMIAVISLKWTENYGDVNTNIRQSFQSALNTIQTDKRILCLGIIQSLFEGSMYTFVLEWTPALTPSEADVVQSAHMETEGHRGVIPHGIIFAAFMVAIMIGSSLFKILCKYSSIESFMRPVLLTSVISLLPALLTSSQLLIFCGFVVFEVCVGVFWPSMGTLRSKYVPEETRATIMNCFRVPLNLIVVLILLQNLSMPSMFVCCVLFLSAAVVCQHILYRLADDSIPVQSNNAVKKQAESLTGAITLV